MRKLILYYNTLKYLKITQVYYQLKKRIISKKKRNLPNRDKSIYTTINILIDEIDLDKNYLDRFHLEKIFDNKVELLNEEHELNLNSWHEPSASHLWNFNLHYFEYLIPLAVAYKKTHDNKYYLKFKEILSKWIDNNTYAEGDAWAPYTISLRIPNLLICIELFGDMYNEDENFKDIINDNIYTQYRYLLNNQELALLGNHYLENLKTIVLSSIYFREENIFKEYLKKLLLELNEQILDDGMHFELSLMYHKIILEAVLRVSVALKNERPDVVNKNLKPILQKMLDVLVSLEKGMGKTPYFNDSADNISKDTLSLVSAAEKEFKIVPQYKESFQSSKYHKLYEGNIAILFDTGEIGPSYMSGHGHCDALSFELSICNTPVFVNSGTFNYQSELRSFFRSTEAHNTLTIGGQQQSECWGEHRTGRRIKKSSFNKKKNGIIGSYKNYLNNYHQREISVVNKNTIKIRDKVYSRKDEVIQSFFHLSPDFKATNHGGYCIIKDKFEKKICEINFNNVKDIHIHREGILTNYSSQFGLLQKKNVIEVVWDSSKKSSETILRFI